MSEKDRILCFNPYFNGYFSLRGKFIFPPQPSHLSRIVDLPKTYTFFIINLKILNILRLKTYYTLASKAVLSIILNYLNFV